MLRDKDRRGFLAELAPLIDRWHLTGLPGTRGTPAERLAEELAALGVRARVSRYPGAEAALRGVQSETGPGDQVVVTGSFLTVAGVLRSLSGR
jgi:dihydrofolate synthase/folylpolyglutamate synthase